MQRSGIVNYHVHKPLRQVFELDAGGFEGNENHEWVYLSKMAG
ncbi:hypothetical protein [Ruegeria atlantica]|nr:hypothetical protein [Ruegeria atlantica]